VVWGLGHKAGAWSYRELAQRALAVAGALQAHGVQPGDAVAVQLPKGPDQILAVLGSSPPGGPMCQSDSTNRMRGAPRFSRPPTSSPR